MTNKHGCKKIQAAIGVYEELLTVVKKQKLWLFDYTKARGYKTFFMLNSAEHRILHAHKYKHTKKWGIFLAQISLDCYFSCS